MSGYKAWRLFTCALQRLCNRPCVAWSKTGAYSTCSISVLLGSKANFDYRAISPNRRWLPNGSRSPFTTVRSSTAAANEENLHHLNHTEQSDWCNGVWPQLQLQLIATPRLDTAALGQLGCQSPLVTYVSHPSYVLSLRPFFLQNVKSDSNPEGTTADWGCCSRGFRSENISFSSRAGWRWG